MPSAVTHFYSGQPMHFYSGVDIKASVLLIVEAFGRGDRTRAEEITAMVEQVFPVGVFRLWLKNDKDVDLT
ncbi:MAG: hypothetical protein FJX47_16320 [Alphaproteobacteria bacterium]|nr:hypothetical protein [Alphaproteobacteria bacterium]